MKAVVFANGVLNEAQAAKAAAAQADLIIAVDGGANHCNCLGIFPHILLGDLDSVAAGVLKKYRQKDVEICQYPADKDKTDLELALDLAIEKEAIQIEVFAALGGRWDMSLANLLLLAAPQYAGIEILVVGDETTIGICRSGEEKTFPYPEGTTLSLLPLNGNAIGVTATGFKYPLENATLNFTSSRGVSNVVTSQGGRISVQSGVLLWIALTADRED